MIFDLAGALDSDSRTLDLSSSSDAIALWMDLIAGGRLWMGPLAARIETSNAIC